MKLHWVELENWRQHRKTRIDFDAKAIVIYGQNETGKSHVFEALSRGLFDRSSSNAEAIRHVRPLTASGNVTSTVRIEFTLKKKRYRVEKDFNLRKGTALYRIDGEKSTLLNQDTGADEQIIELLEAGLPSTRGSKPSNWGAFQWLWAPQDRRELPDSREGDPTTSLHLEAKDRAGVLITLKLQGVLNSVGACCSSYFTATGQIKKDSPVSRTALEIATLEERRDEQVTKIREMDDDRRQLEEFQGQLPELEKKVEKTKAELEKARTEAMDFSAIESELNASEVRVKGTERDVREAQKGLDELRKSANRIEGLQQEERQAKAEFTRLEAMSEQMEAKTSRLREEVDEKAAKVREAEELCADARILWTQHDTQNKITELEKKISRISDIKETIERRGEKQISVVPTSEEIEEFVQNQSRIEALAESLRARGLTVTIAPGKRGSLEVEVDGERVKEGEVSATGTETVKVGAPGLGNVTIKANLEQAKDAKTDILRREERISKALKKFAVGTLQELQELTRTQSNIRDQIRELSAERRGIDERPIEDLRIELARLQEKYQEYSAIERTSTAIKLNPTGADLGELIKTREKEERRARETLDDARMRRDNVDNELVGIKEELAMTRATQEHISSELEYARTEEREVIRQYGSEEYQERVLAGAKASLQKLSEECQKAKQAFEDMEKGPINRIARLEKQVENQELVVRQHTSGIDQLRGKMEAESLGGAYSELAHAEYRIEVLRERLENEQIHAESYRLLKEALEQQYRSALSVVAGPIKEDVRRTLGYVTGFLHDDVQLNEYLFPTKLGERGLEELSLEFDDASSGLREALALCVRLAVAKHLSGEDSQCLVLDDPFVHVSSDRSDRMIELINNAIEEHGLQIVIFTHRPMEFAGLAGKMVDIQAVKQ
ncbi:hypothetical protein ES703_03895 [subsurface metagenome]